MPFNFENYSFFSSNRDLSGTVPFTVQEIRDWAKDKQINKGWANDLSYNLIRKGLIDISFTFLKGTTVYQYDISNQYVTWKDLSYNDPQLVLVGLDSETIKKIIANKLFQRQETVDETTLSSDLPVSYDKYTIVIKDKLRDSYELEATDVFDQKIVEVVVDNKDDFKAFLATKLKFVEEAFENRVVEGYTEGNTVGSYIEFTDRDGLMTRVYGELPNKQCSFRENCTKNHLHYSGGCTTNMYTDKDDNNKKHYKCACTGKQVFDAKPHSHCMDFQVDNNFKYKEPQKTLSDDERKIDMKKQSYDYAYDTAYNKYDSYLGDGTYAQYDEYGNPLSYDQDYTTSRYGVNSQWSDETMDLTNNMQHSGGALGTNTHNMLQGVIYDYYLALNTNMKLKNDFSPTKLKANELSMSDSMIKSQLNYLHLFNMFAGMGIICGCIFILQK